MSATCRKCKDPVQLLYIPVLGYIYFCYKCKGYKSDRQVTKNTEPIVAKTEGK